MKKGDIRETFTVNRETKKRAIEGKIPLCPPFPKGDTGGLGKKDNAGNGR